MRTLLCAYGLAVLLAFGATPALAQDVPAGGVTVPEVAQWLRSKGYPVQLVTLSKGSVEIRSASNGVNFYIHFYDCHGGPRCASLGFDAGFNTHGRFDLAKENAWNSNNRWARVSIDKNDDPWLVMDVDVFPGGTYTLLNDELGIWRDMLSTFAKSINF